MLIWILASLYSVVWAAENLAIQHVGCFRDNETIRDLPFQVFGPNSGVEDCIVTCRADFFFFAGLQNGQECFCGSQYGRYGQGICDFSCFGNSQQICGGKGSNTIYKTNLLKPGPPTNLKLNETKETSLSISWTPPDTPKSFVTQYTVEAHIVKTFDSISPLHTSKHIQLSNSSTRTTVIGLLPGSEYNITVTAASSHGSGPPVSALLWTEVGTPDVPETPQIIHHGGSHVEGEIHVKLFPLDFNRKGPVTAYQIVVIDESTPGPFHEEKLFDWTRASEEGINYWVAAEIQPDWFKANEEFVVGDGKLYGEYLNHGPLDSSRDYHVTVGVVSMLNNLTKRSFARVSHDQHAMENIVVFDFHPHRVEGETHNHGDHQTQYSVASSPPPSKENSDLLAIGLSVAIAIMGLIFAAVLAFYIYLRRVSPRRSGSRGEIQELTTHRISNGDLEGFENGIAIGDEVKTPVSLESIRSRVWSVPRNFLDLSHEVIGRGKFGSVVKGQVNKRGFVEHCNVQVVPGKILDDDELQMMIQSLDLAIRCGAHLNVIQLIGICEDKETIFVILDEATLSLKQLLLDNRCLIHQPSVAEQMGKFSILKEEKIIEYLRDIAAGMAYLSSRRILHRRLCGRHVFISGNGAKVGGFGITDYIKPGYELDMTRWKAQETFQSKNFSSKCDVWSFGILMWEAITLGATPYSTVKTRDVAARVIRGLRLPQTRYMSDDLYQVMLQCWQIDLDERPDFSQLLSFLNDADRGATPHFNLSLYTGFQYEEFDYDLECLR